MKTRRVVKRFYDVLGTFTGYDTLKFLEVYFVALKLVNLMFKFGGKDFLHENGQECAWFEMITTRSIELDYAKLNI